ncbi:GNAT family N-acetyltransferase [Pseudoruegeria sp. HB172150]|uniref:GNAT family N-acetyltransferase n=1 Tax=Pseudoruegeria sp. HB172150 TaxID=2721164 RepID=UPI00155648EC|nr:GNAT family N-acetyltransferase [Pseudoruegeria sp. HB172150]
MSRAPLATARLRLRRPEAADAGWIARSISLPEVQKNLTSPPHPFQQHHAEEWLAREAEKPTSLVIEGDEEEPLGVVTLRTGEVAPVLGYWLKPGAWGRGYMTEAAGAVLADHFAQTETTAHSGYMPDHPTSGRVLAKLGFVELEPELRQCHFRGGEVPVMPAELTAQRWRSLRQAAQ